MNLKKAVLLVAITATVILVASCKSNKSTTEKITEDQPSGEVSSSDGVDVDLTELSSTMVYSEVYNMMYLPENYVGKTVKMRGLYVPYHDEATGKYYHNCLIMDATACCSQSIEFELTDDYNYPGDYPAEGQDFCVSGTFDTYMEGTDKYCTLRNAKLIDL